jgi:ligand-binding sensor domain-containing protein
MDIKPIRNALERSMISRIHRIGWLAGLVLCSMTARGQIADWVQYTSGNQITALAEKGNFLWVGTTNGLVKIDKTGLAASVFYNQANSTLPSNRITAIAVQSSDTVWIGTANAGLVRFNGTVFVAPPAGYTGGNVNAIAVTGDTVYVGTRSGLWECNSKTVDWLQHARGAENLPSDTVTALAVGESGRLWMGTDKGVAWYQGSFFPTNMGLTDLQITSIAVDLNGAPCVGTRTGGFARMIDVGGEWIVETVVNGLPSNTVQAVAVDAQFLRYAGTDAGLAVYTGNAWEITTTSITGFPGNNVTAVLNGADGTVWVGTNGGGLGKRLASGGWSKIATANSGLVEQKIIDVAVAGTGNVWTCANGSVASFNGSSWFVYTPATLGIQDIFTCIAADAAGNPWVGTEANGIFHHTGTAWESFNTDNVTGFPDNTIYDVAVAPNGDVWVGTYGGAARYSAGTWTAFSTTSTPGIPDNTVRNVEIGTDGSVWIADNSSYGPVKYTGTNWMEQNGASINLTPALFSVKHVTATGGPWVVTPYNGASLYNGTGWDGPFNASNTNSPSSNVRDIVQDLNSNPWFAFNNGIARFDKTGLIFNDIFNASNSGLPAGAVNAIAVGPDNRLWAATDSGLAVYSGIGIVAAPGILLKPATLPFGAVTVNQTATRTAVVKSTGTANLSITEVIVPAGYAIQNLPTAFPLTILPGDSISWSVQFTPTQTVTYGGPLVVFSNAVSTPDTILILGNGVAATGPVIRFNPPALSFENVIVGRTRSLSASMKNIGTANLIVSSVQHPAGFSQTNNYTFPITILPGDSIVGIIDFTPTQARVYSGYTVVVSNASTSPDSALLTGTGVPVSPLQGPGFEFSRSTLDFGDRVINQSSTYLSVMIRNTGIAALTVGSIQIVQNHAGGFVKSLPTTPAVVAAGDSIALRILFQPVEIASYSGSAIVISDAPSSPDTLILTGRGIQPPNLVMTRRDYAFGTFAVSQTGTLSRWVRNAGPGILTVDSMKIYQNSSGGFSIIGRTFPYSIPSIQARDSVQVSVQFTPNSVQTYAGELEIYSNNSTSPYVAFLGGSVSMQNLTLTDEDVHYHTGHYAMLAVPYDLQDKRLSTAFPDLEPYSQKKMRIYHWKTNDYIEYPFFPPADSLTFRPGVAYWITAKDSINLVLNNVRSTPLNSSGHFNIQLRPGWNMIGNPFPYSVAWNLVKSTLDTALIHKIRAPVVYNVMWQEYNIDPYYYNQQYLEPWRGYFVYNDTTVTVVIQVPPGIAIPNLAKHERVLLADEFILHVRATGLDTKWRSGGSSVGMLKTAVDDLDDEDYYEAPAIGEHLRLSILEARNRFAGNFKACSAEGAAWDFELASTGKSESVKIEFTPEKSLPDGFSIRLLDTDRECAIPVSDRIAELNMKGSGENSRLRLIVGTDAFIEKARNGISLVPYRLALFPCFPNPFNPETHIEYDLPEKGPVSLEIYDVTGRLVRTLVRAEQGTGSHAETWDGRDDEGGAVPSGVYLCRISAGDFAVSRKMILIR